MKKPPHDYYNIDEVVEKWKMFDPSVSEKDILKWGATGKLKFSIWVAPKKQFSYIYLIMEYYEKKKLNENERKKGNPEWWPVPCDEKKIKNGYKKLYCISKKTVDFLLNTKTNRRVSPIIYPSCYYNNKENGSDTQCKNCVVTIQGKRYGKKEFETVDLHITKNDLIITHDELVKFENDFVKPKEIKPPYLDPEHEFYSVTLDLAIRTWEAIFIDKKYLDKKSARMAGQAYLNSSDSGCEKLLEERNMEFKDRTTSRIAKIAIGEYSPNKIKWNEFRKQK